MTVEETQGDKSLPEGEAAVPDDDWLEDADYEVLLDGAGYLKRSEEIIEPLPQRMDVFEFRYSFSDLSLEKQIRVLQEQLNAYPDTHRPFCYQGHTIRTISGPMSVITETSDADWDNAEILDADEWLEEQIMLDELTDEELCFFSEYDIGLELYNALGEEKAKEVGLEKDFGGLFPGHRFAAVRFRGSVEELQARFRQHGLRANVCRVE